jgi:ubiquinone/menaquinone biosynthesis C-methylase UbiE
MGITRGLAEQLARPNGLAGRLLGGVMDVANRRPTRLAIDLLAPRVGEAILDAGCGTGAAMVQLLRRAPCQVTGVDPSDTMLEAARKKISGRGELYRAGLDMLPFPDAAFDAVLLLNVLYFCDAEGHMIANVRRVLKPGGRLVGYVTHRETMEKWPFAREGMHRLFNEAELAATLVAGGFATNQVCVHAASVTRSVKGLLAYANR